MAPAQLPPPALVAAMALFLGSKRVFLLVEEGADDSALAFLEEVSEQTRFMVAQLLPAGDTGKFVLHGALVVEVGNVCTNLKDDRLFRSDVHWLSSFARNSSQAPYNLRFDSNFYSASNNYMNGTWAIYEKFASPTKKGKVENRSVETLFAGTWTENENLEINKNIWERRNLQGITLKVTTVPSSRFMIKKDEGFTGLIADIVAKMADMSNFTVEWVVPNDGAYGSQGSDGSWNGMVRLLQDKKVDMSAALLSLSLSRNKVISYLSPYLESKSTLLVNDKTLKASTGSINVSGYVSVFDGPAWICLFCTLLLEVLIFFMFIKRTSPTSARSENIKKSLFLTMDIFLKLNLPQDFTFLTASRRMLLFVSGLFPVVIMAYYEGLLTSYMTIHEQLPELKSIADILTTGHTIALVNNSIQLSEFMNAPPGSGREKVYNKLIKDNPSALYKTGFELDAAALEDPNIVIAGNAIKGYTASTGIYGLAGLDDAIPDPLAFAVQKNSEYLDMLNYNMIQLYQSGVLEFIKGKWIRKQKPKEICSNNFENQNARSGIVVFITIK